MGRLEKKDFKYSIGDRVFHENTNATIVGIDMDEFTQLPYLIETDIPSGTAKLDHTPLEVNIMNGSYNPKDRHGRWANANEFKNIR